MCEQQGESYLCICTASMHRLTYETATHPCLCKHGTHDAHEPELDK